MENLTQQQELDIEENLENKFIEIFSRQNLEELYLIKAVLEKEIRLSETATKEGFEWI